MHCYQVSEDLVLEVWPGGDGDRPLVRVRSLSMEKDDDSDAVGVVVVYPEELDALIAALVETLESFRHSREKGSW